MGIYEWVCFFFLIDTNYLHTLTTKIPSSEEKENRTYSWKNSRSQEVLKRDLIKQILERDPWGKEKDIFILTALIVSSREKIENLSSEIKIIVWLTSINMVISSCIHVAINGIYSWVILIVYRYHIFIHSSWFASVSWLL